MLKLNFMGRINLSFFAWLSVMLLAAPSRAAFTSELSIDRRAPLPAEVVIGAATIHRYVEPKVNPKEIAITVWVPTPSPDLPGTLVNMNRLRLPAELPNVWIIGDGGSTRAVVGVDLTKPSGLSDRIDAIIQTAARSDEGKGQKLLDFILRNANRWIAWTSGAAFNDGRPELPWDLAIRKVGDLSTSFRAAGERELFHFPVTSGVRFPVVALEHYLDRGEGYCLQKALLASLLLSRAGVIHRLVNGAVVQEPGISVGHTWIELSDGRVLDVAWEKLELPSRGHPDHPDWIKVGDAWRFENANYLILKF